MFRFFSVIIFLSSLYGCGDDKSPTIDSKANKVWNESEITEVLKVKKKNSGIGNYFVTKDGIDCGVAVIITSQAAINMYKQAGDVVASNESNTAGVKIVARESRKCLDSANEILKDLK